MNRVVAEQLGFLARWLVIAALLFGLGITYIVVPVFTLPTPVYATNVTTGYFNITGATQDGYFSANPYNDWAAAVLDPTPNLQVDAGWTFFSIGWQSVTVPPLYKWSTYTSAFGFNITNLPEGVNIINATVILNMTTYQNQDNWPVFISLYEADVDDGLLHGIDHDNWYNVTQGTRVSMVLNFTTERLGLTEWDILARSLNRYISEDADGLVWFYGLTHYAAGLFAPTWTGLYRTFAAIGETRDGTPVHPPQLRISWQSEPIIDDAIYNATIEIVNNGTEICNQTVNITLDTQTLIENGWVNVNATNIAVVRMDGTSVPFMLAPNSTDTLMVFIEGCLGQNETLRIVMSFGGDYEMGGTMRHFPCATGLVTLDAADLEPANNFSITVEGYMNTIFGVGSNITSKPGAGTVNITDIGNITGTVNGTSLTMTDVWPGEYNVTLNGNATQLSLWLDGVQQVAANWTAPAADTANNWTFAESNAVPYVRQVRLMKDDVTELFYDLSVFISEDTVADDGDDPENTGTLCFAETGSDPNVGGRILTFTPVFTPKANVTLLAQQDAVIWDAPPDVIPELYTELQTNHLPGASFINDLLGHAGIPQSLFWFPAVFFTSIGLGLVGYALMKSLLWQAVVSGMIMVYAALMTGGGIIPFWTVAVFAIEALAIIWTTRQRPVP